MPDLQKELKDSIETLNREWIEFKAANEQTGANASAEQMKKMDTISAAMDQAEDKIKSLETQLARSNNGGSDENSVSKEYRDAFDAFARKGDEDGIANLSVRNDLSVGTDSEGGVTIPEELDRDILKLADGVSSMRPYVTVRTIGGAAYKKLVQSGGVASGWVGEKAARPKTDGPGFSALSPTFGEVYANPAATQVMLDDAFFSVEDLLSDEGGREFMRQEEQAFVSGNGANKPIGLLAGSMDYLDDDSRAFGVIQKVKTGVANALPAAGDTFNFLMDLQDQLKEEYEANAVWMLRRKTKTKIRQVKDNDGQYIWERGIKDGQPGILLGAPVANNSYYPDIAANALPISYGDMKQAYYIIDRIGTRVLRDPYTNKPFVQFYMTKRVGSMIVNTEAVKVVECAA